MQPTILTDSTLHEFYSKVILPQFGITHKHIIWQEHLIIGPDNDAHVFLCNDEQMVLVFDDYPTTTLKSLQTEFDDNGAARIMPNGSGDVDVDIPTREEACEKHTVYFGPGSTPYTYVHNITGSFQLFRLSTTASDVRLMRLKLRRRLLDRESEVYASLLDIGFEMITLGEKGAIWDGLAHMALSVHYIAKQHAFGDLADFLYDLGEDADLYESMFGLSFDEYLAKIKKELLELASESHINPGVTDKEQSLLDANALPIHTKMMQDPTNSPIYFKELAEELNHLIQSGG